MGNLKTTRNADQCYLDIYKRVEMLTTQIDFMKALSRLKFITAFGGPASYLCTDFSGSYEISQSDNEAFYLEHQGSIMIISLSFCYESSCFILKHNILDMPIIKNPTIQQVKDYYFYDLVGITGQFRLQAIEAKIAYDNKLIQDRINRENAPCIIYLALDITCGYHKVGQSKNVASRELVLMAQKPTIKVVAQYNGIVSDEKAVHDILHSHGLHIRGEWFNLQSEAAMKLVDNYFTSKYN